MAFDDKKELANSFGIPFLIPENVSPQTRDSLQTTNTSYGSMSIFVDQISKEEPPLKDLSFISKLSLITGMVISLTVGSYFKNIMYTYVFTTNKTNRGWMHRPINVLTITSAIIHHVTHVSCGVWYILILMTETPLGDLMGVYSCRIIDVVGVYGLVHLVVGSFGISVYRILYIHHDNWVKYVIGEKVLLALIVSLGTFASGQLVGMYMIESNSQRTQLNMCRGLSVTQTQIIMEYDMTRGNEILLTNFLRSTTISICIALRTIEFGIYVWVFWLRYSNDNGKIRDMLPQGVIHDRNIKNITTFSSQFYVFIVEYIFYISVLILTFHADEKTHHYKTLVGMVKFMDFGLLSFVEVFSSPGLRSFMKSYN